ncbi:unnamed protein product, partial [Pylaiella littoralis]
IKTRPPRRKKTQTHLEAKAINSTSTRPQFLRSVGNNSSNPPGRVAAAGAEAGVASGGAG